MNGIKDCYVIGNKINNDYYIFSTLLAYATNINQFQDIFKHNNVGGPFSFIYETIFGHVVETDTFDNLEDAEFCSERACVNLKSSESSLEAFFLKDENITLPNQRPHNGKCFQTLNIYLKANSTLKNNNKYNQCIEKNVYVARATINLVDNWKPNELLTSMYNSDSGDAATLCKENDILIKIEEEFELKLSPLLYLNNQQYKDLNNSKKAGKMPKIGMTILLQKIDPQFLPNSLTMVSNDDNSIKNKVNYCHEICGCFSKQDHKIDAKRKEYNKLIKLAKRLIQKLIEKDDQKLNNHQKLEQRINELEKELNNKIYENLNLCEKVRCMGDKIQEQNDKISQRQIFDKLLSSINLTSDKKDPDCTNLIDIIKQVNNYSKGSLDIPLQGSSPNKPKGCHPSKSMEYNSSNDPLANIGLFKPDDPYAIFCKSFDKEETREE